MLWVGWRRGEGLRCIKGIKCGGKTFMSCYIRRFQVERHNEGGEGWVQSDVMDRLGYGGWGVAYNKRGLQKVCWCVVRIVQSG